jgi:hypothetical protein
MSIMPITIPSTIQTREESEPAQRSLIKPQLLNLSGSGSRLDGIIIERDLGRIMTTSQGEEDHGHSNAHR